MDGDTGSGGSELPEATPLTHPRFWGERKREREKILLHQLHNNQNN